MVLAIVRPLVPGFETDLLDGAFGRTVLSLARRSAAAALAIDIAALAVPALRLVMVPISRTRTKVCAALEREVTPGALLAKDLLGFLLARPATTKR